MTNPISPLGATPDELIPPPDLIARQAHAFHSLELGAAVVVHPWRRRRKKSTVGVATTPRKLRESIASIIARHDDTDTIQLVADVAYAHPAVPAVEQIATLFVGGDWAVEYRIPYTRVDGRVEWRAPVRCDEATPHMVDLVREAWRSGLELATFGVTR